MTLDCLGRFVSFDGKKCTAWFVNIVIQFNLFLPKNFGQTDGRTDMSSVAILCREHKTQAYCPPLLVLVFYQLQPGGRPWPAAR